MLLNGLLPKLQCAAGLLLASIHTALPLSLTAACWQQFLFPLRRRSPPALLLSSKREARAIRDALIGRGFLQTTAVVAVLRLPPRSPFAFTNLVMVSGGVRAAPFLLGTILGMIPRTFAVILFASAAAQTGAEDIQAFVSDGPGWPVAAGGLGLMATVLAIVGTIARRALIRLRVDPAALS